MPTYALRCRKCGELTEVSLHVAEYEKRRQEDAFECPKCHTHDLAPQIEPFEVRTARKSAAY
jgi:putative FmdB family regulatory protein